MGGADADGGCCTIKRGSGICILVLSIISLVGSVICAVIASFTHMPLYAAFGWIHVLLLIYLISATSAYVCCRACGSKVTGGLAVGYCVLAFVIFIVLATGQQSAMEHYCEGTVECASISDWGDHDPECGHKTSSFSLCYLPETDDRRRRLAAAPAYAEPWYYSKWPDDCQHDDVCRAFRTQDDCINYCYQDDDDEQCEDVDDPEDCNWSIVTHVNAVAGWSTFFAGLVLFPTLVWVVLLFVVPDPQAAAPVTAVELPRMQPQVMMVSPVSPGGGQPQVIMGQPQIAQGGQPPVIMGQPQVVQGGQAPVIMGQPQVVQGAPSKLAEF